MLHGPGGIGKTRLTAQAVVDIGSLFKGCIYGVALDREFRTGTYVALPDTPFANEAETAQHLVLRIAAALENPRNTETIETSGDLIAYLNKRFASAPFLLVLDNFRARTAP